MSPFSVSYSRYLLLRRVCLALALLLIFAIFGMADSSLATGDLNFDPPLDKMLHAGVYGTIAALVWISGVVRSRLLAWLLVVGVGVCDELHQISIAGREASVLDLLADMAGIALALWLVSRLCRMIVVLPRGTD